MLELEHIKHLYGLVAIPLLLLLFWAAMVWRKRAIRRLGNRTQILKLIPLFPVYKYQLKFSLLMLAVLFLVVGLANPQMGTKMEMAKRTGVDVIIAFDVSSSMLAEDIKPNRMQRAKQFVSKLIDAMLSDRVGIIVFAGNAFLQMPLTTDYAAAKMFLANINEKMVPTQGTAIGAAITLARRSFEADEQKYKTLIIITDGESHDEEVLELAETAAAEGVVLHTIGVGTPKGAPIPVYRNGQLVDFKKDQQGSIVLSKLNEEMLGKLAAVSNGEYFHISGGQDEISAIMSEIESMEKKEFDERVFTEYESKYQYLLVACLILLILEFLLSDRKETWLSRFLSFKQTA